MADRVFHDQGFGNQHAIDPAVWDCARLVAGAARLAGENGGRDGCHAAIVHSARRDRLALTYPLWKNGALGAVLWRELGIDVVFTSRAVVLACAVMSFPLLVRSAQSAFQEVNTRFEDIARTLGSKEWRVFRTITLPLAMRGIVAGAILAFARAMGEFGATAIVAGMIPRKTMTISLAIYQNIQLGRDAAALPLLAVSIAIVFAAVLFGQTISKRSRRS